MNSQFRTQTLFTNAKTLRKQNVNNEINNLTYCAYPNMIENG